MFVHIRHEQVQKTLCGFFFQNYCLGEKAVAGAVTRGVLFSLLRDGASGVGSVGSCGLNLFGGHGN